MFIILASYVKPTDCHYLSVLFNSTRTDGFHRGIVKHGHKLFEPVLTLYNISIVFFDVTINAAK